MAQDIHNNDQLFNGNVVAKGLYSNNPTITNDMVSAAAALATSKMGHRFERAGCFGASSTTTAAAIRQVAHIVKGATGTLEDFSVGAVTAAVGDSTVTIDLLKNGSTILTATITLDSGTAAFILKQPAGYTSTSLVVGDVLEVKITSVSAGTGTLPAGVFFRLTLSETYA